MDFLVSEIVSLFYTFLWPLIRFSAFFLTAPLFSLAAVSVRIRITLAFLLTWVVYPFLDLPIIDPLSSLGISEVFVQAAIGAIGGIILQLVNAAFVVGGQSMSASMGLAMANMVDPNMGNVPVISQFLLICGILVFMILGGHLIVIQIMANSFQTLPIGNPLSILDLTQGVLLWSGSMFVGALMIALPVLASLLFINLGLGVITRSAPALNIFSLGFPAMILGGLVIIVISMPGFVRRAESLWFIAFDRIRETYGI